MFWNVCFYSDTLTLSQIDGFSGRAEINNKMLLKCLCITPLWGKDWDGILLSAFCFLTFLILHMTATIWLCPLSFQLPIFNKDLMKKLCTQQFLLKSGRDKKQSFWVFKIFCAVQFRQALPFHVKLCLQHNKKMPRMSSNYHLVPSCFAQTSPDHISSKDCYGPN